MQMLLSKSQILNRVKNVFLFGIFQFSQLRRNSAQHGKKIFAPRRKVAKKIKSFNVQMLLILFACSAALRETAFPVYPG